MTSAGQEKYIFFLSTEIWSKKISPRFKGKITPPPPKKMSFSSKKGHFKTHDAHFYKKKVYVQSRVTYDK